MSVSLPTWFFGAFMFIFVIGLAISAWLAPQTSRTRIIRFSVFHTASLIFVLCFVLFGWRKSESQFIEIGQYYTLAPSISAVSIGSSSSLDSEFRPPDYILDKGCKGNNCFQGRVVFSLERKSSGPNLLTWQPQDIDGTFAVKEFPGIGKRLVQSLGFDKGSEDGAKGIALPGEFNRISATWRPRSPERSPVTLTITVELNPKDDPPRLIIEHPKPEVYELPSVRNFETEREASPAIPTTIYLTTSQLVSLRSPGGTGYVPTISVSQADSKAVVNAYIEKPTPEEAAQGDAFIVNNGIYRTGNPFGRRVFVGADRGVVATVASGGANQFSFVIALVFLWILPLVFFLPIISHTELIEFVPAVQMLVAVRIVLALRAYLWPPYNHEAIEGATLAAIIIPLLIFIGVFAVGLQGIGRLLEEDRWKKPWYKYLIKNFPPVVYYAVALITLPVLFIYLRGGSTEFSSTSVRAFHDWGELLKSEAILAFLPPVVWFVGLLLDRMKRKGTAGNRDMAYVGGVDDPITYSMTQVDEDEHESMIGRRVHLVRLLPVLVVGVCLVGIAFVLPSAIAAFIAGPLALVLSWSLMRYSRLAEAGNKTIAAAARCLAWTAIAAGTLILLKDLWNLSLGRGLPKAIPEALFPFIPLRTNAAFELLILILTIRLLAAFFQHWRRADSPFGGRGFLEITIVFLTPPMMFAISFLASHDNGAILVYWPALVGATLIVTGLWPLWKVATGRRDALWAILVAAGTVFLVGWLFYGLSSTNLVMSIGPHSRVAHRIVLREGPEVSASAAETGGPHLIEAMEQYWRTLNYAAEGGWTGRGYGNAIVEGGKTFQDITLSDLVFSTYVLCEHGALGGLSLLAVYILILLLVLKAAWQKLRDEPLHLALATACILITVFPAIYMAAANVNQWLFTGQDMPLLGLRSRSDIVRTGIFLMLAVASLRPLTSTVIEHQTVATPSWLRLLRQSFIVGFALILGGRAQKKLQLGRMRYDRWGPAAAIAANMALVISLLVCASAFPLIGILHASGNESYKESFDLTQLKELATKYIRDGHIWFEPVQANAPPGRVCRGGVVKNTAAPDGVDPTSAYQLCIDDNVRGAAEGDTFEALVRQWNNRNGLDKHRGDGDRPGTRHDERQFFRLDTVVISRKGAQAVGVEALIVNPYIYRWTSPFRQSRGWIGALTDANTSQSSAGSLVGAALILPLRSAPYGELPVMVGTEHVPVYLDQPQTYQSARGFAVYEASQGANRNGAIFYVSTISGAEGATLKAGSGDFDLFINGCPLIGGKNECSETNKATGGNDARSSPRIRLDYGDVIAYAPRDPSHPERRTARYVFTYARAQLGTFSYTAWINGQMRRSYPQGETLPLAQQVTRALAGSLSLSGDHSAEDVALTIDADLNRDVYNSLREWRAQLDEHIPIRKPGSSRRLAVTLMDSESGALLALASEDGTPYDPNRGDPTDSNREVNLNLTRHRIGSAIKPFTAAATLSVFPRLHEMVLYDRRSDDKRVFGFPIGGQKGLHGHSNPVTWRQFLPLSDNLYAVTLSMLGMCDATNSSGLPRFTNAQTPTSPLQVTMTDKGSSLGTPVWASSNMFDADDGRCALLEQTPLRRQLEELFDIRAGAPQVRSYGNNMWSPLEKRGILSDKGLADFNLVSPEIPNLALADVRNFDDLRAVLLGGEIGDLPEYGSVGSAWSNVYLAQSFARITTGRRVTAQIVADVSASPTASGARTEGQEWTVGYLRSPWRRALLGGLEGVARERGATAYAALGDTIRRINSDRGISDMDVPFDIQPRYAVGSGRDYFTVFCKTGTLDPDNEGPLLDDSIFVFTAGIWDDAANRFCRSVTGAIYLEQATMGQAQRYAAKLLRMLNSRPRFNWSKVRGECHTPVNADRNDQ